LRVDCGVEEGGEISPFYDPMIAKLIAHADTREMAAEALATGCRSIEVWPVRTNAAFLARCAAHPDFVAAKVDTDFIADRLEELTARTVSSLSPGAVAAVGRLAAASSDSDRRSPWRSPGGAAGLRLNAPSVDMARIYVDGAPTRARFDFSRTEPVLMAGEGEAVVFADGAAFSLTLRSGAERTAAAGASDGVIRAPMPGRIASVAVAPDEAVVAGQTLVVLEAMKMEHALTAPFAGVVAEVTAGEGDQVSEGATLVRLDTGP
jgi:acetyl/propionyl-CoA carboxylase alpha subunit